MHQCIYVHLVVQHVFLFLLCPQLDHCPSVMGWILLLDHRFLSQCKVPSPQIRLNQTRNRFIWFHFGLRRSFGPLLIDVAIVHHLVLHRNKRVLFKQLRMSRILAWSFRVLKYSPCSSWSCSLERTKTIRYRIVGCLWLEINQFWHTKVSKSREFHWGMAKATYSIKSLQRSEALTVC